MIGSPATLECHLDRDTAERVLQAELGNDARVSRVTPVSLSSSLAVCRVELEDGASYDLKARPAGGQGFEEEVFRLRYLAENSSLPVPRVVAWSNGSVTLSSGSAATLSSGSAAAVPNGAVLLPNGFAQPFPYCVLEHVPGIPWSHASRYAPLHRRAAIHREIGAVLGRFHRESQGPAFYVVEPGTIRGYGTWPEFFSSLWSERIEHFLAMDRLETGVLDAIEWIHSHLGRLLKTVETPRLIHGNLCASKILIDLTDDGWTLGGFLDPLPAYAHRELDLALMELRGSADPSFFEGYCAEIPIDDGYDFRKRIYMLYHVLEDVRLHGETHQILTAMELVRGILRVCAV